MEKQVKLVGDYIVVKVKVAQAGPKDLQLRIYTKDARRMAQEAYPGKEISGPSESFTVSNQKPDALEAEWHFGVLSDNKKESKSSSTSSKKKVVKDAKSDTKENK